MNLHYYVSANGNFGDDLNLWIWDKLLPNWSLWDDKTTLLGIGTVLTQSQASLLANERILVIGSGAGKKKVPNILNDTSTWDIRAVRGPRTAQRLGVPPSLAITDPAVLISDLSEFSNNDRSDVPLFIPHHNTVGLTDWASLCQEVGLSYISPCDESRSVICNIASAPLVIAESLHAAIIADSFRVPWIPLQVSAGFDTEKWLDWAESLNISLNLNSYHQPIKKRILHVLGSFSRHLANDYSSNMYSYLRSLLTGSLHQTPIMSSTNLLEDKKSLYYDVLSSITNDYS